jgi:hypothetical protein
MVVCGNQGYVAGPATWCWTFEKVRCHVAHTIAQLETPVLLVPVLGFFDLSVGESFLRGQPWLTSRLREERYGVLRVAQCIYIPYGEPFTVDVLNQSSLKNGQTQEIPLREKGVKLPEGAFISCLLVGGKHEVRSVSKVNGAHSALWSQTVSGGRDAYAEWMTLHGTPYERALHIVRDSTSRDSIVRRIYSARSGRGIVYTREPEIREDGRVISVQERLVSIVFEVRKAEANGEVLSIGMKRRTRRMRGPNDLSDAIMDGFEIEKTRVAQRAIAGYRRTCQTIRADLEERIRFMRSQMKKMQRDGAAYIKRIDLLPCWKEALATVDEPWQLALVIDAFCDEEFCASPEIFDPEFQRIQRMLNQFPCSVQRRGELIGMAKEYGLIPAA